MPGRSEPPTTPPRHPPRLGSPEAEQRIARVERALGLLATCRALDVGVLPIDAWRARARTDAARLLPPSPDPGAIDPERPIYLAGANPPGLLERLADMLPRAESGWWTPIYVVEPDPMAFLDALGDGERPEVFAQERVRLFVGPDALDRLRAHLIDHLPYGIRGGCINSRVDDDDLLRRLAGVVDEACTLQANEVAGLRASVRARERRRASTHWQHRFADRGPDGAPPRVLFWTTRYSTFVRHAAQDAADGFTQLGCAARVLIEPDDSTKLSSLALLRAVDQFDPDLIVLINYTRSILAKDLPETIPLVTWVQDAMYHLFTPEAWQTRGPNDFLFGHGHRDFFERFGFPRERSRTAFVPASEAKFHGGPVAPDLARRLACDIAFVTNHAETPERLVERFRHDAGGNPLVHALLDDVQPRIRDVLADTMSAPILVRLRDAGLESLRACGGPTDASSLDRFMDQIVLPLAGRMFRHEAAHWAAQLADERGWSFRLYGNGWERHPALARFAAGPLDHAEELRAAYQRARVNLHASLHGPHHQRIVECALSGGFPIARRTLDDLQHLREHTVAVLSRDRQASHTLLESRSDWHWTADDPRAMRLAAQLQRLGVPARERIFDAPRAREPEPASRILPDDVAWLMGDLAETTFDSPEALETLVTHAIESPRQRTSLAEGIAARARTHLTYKSAARQMLEMVREHFAAANTNSAKEGSGLRQARRILGAVA